APDFTSSEQSDVTSPPQPRPLNRRERRALEFAQREGQAPAAEGEAAPGAIKSDSAEIGNVEAGSAEIGNVEASNDEAGVDVSNAEAGAAEAGATETGSEDAAAKPRAAKRAARDGERSERPSESRRPREFAGRSEGSERPARSRGDDEGRPSRPRSSEGEGRFARGPGGDDDRPRRRGGDEDVETYRIEVGHAHGVKPGNIVGAIANEAGLEGNRIGRVTIRDDHSFVDLPAGMPKEVFQQLQKVRVAGQQLQLSRALKTHVEKLRRERPSAPKFRANVDSKGVRPKSRSARDTPRRR
ncbi:DbpA RNA binding domain-containing protein, partial [Steroidobacter sp.]|uniref:DbpA RNA binding domain-containing protein n=1 Tax=Steroidobacter sp. TaxID=1978227 RepID=UPI001A6205F6